MKIITDKIVNLKRIVFYVVIFSLLLCMLYFIPTSYYIVMPGRTREVSSMITVEGKSYKSRGEFLITTVYSMKAPLLLYIYGLLDPRMDLFTTEAYLPGGINKKDYENIMEKAMATSIDIARIVALKAAGFDVHFRGGRLKVDYVLEESNAKNKLIEGDIIVSVDKKKIYSLSDLLEFLDGKLPGEVVTIEVWRKEEILSFDIETIDDGQGRAWLGMFIGKEVLDVNLPFQVEIDTEKISGSSAGLMIALGVYDLLTEDDLTRGFCIAGTGTIDLNGKVGPVFGVKQKVEIAKSAGAKLFFVPRQNFKEACSRAVGIRIIPVESFEQTINFMTGLPR